MDKQKERTELKHIKRKWRQEIDRELKQIEADLEELGDIDLAMQIETIRHELHIRLISIGEDKKNE